MNDFSRVVEESPRECFKVLHRVLRVPKNVYFQVVSSNDDPLSEEAVQEFVQEYLNWKEPDTNGLVGMVRGEEQEDYILLDAAVRYPLYAESRH